MDEHPTYHGRVFFEESVSEPVNQTGDEISAEIAHNERRQNHPPRFRFEYSRRSLDAEPKDQCGKNDHRYEFEANYPEGAMSLRRRA
jgi:hypothetical protein